MCILPNCKLVSEMVIIIEHHYRSIRLNELELNVLLITIHLEIVLNVGYLYLIICKDVLRH